MTTSVGQESKDKVKVPFLITTYGINPILGLNAIKTFIQKHNNTTQLSLLLQSIVQTTGSNVM